MSAPKTENSNERESAAQMSAKTKATTQAAEKSGDVSQAKPKAKKPTKQEVAAKAVEKMRQATLKITPAPAPSELVMMPLSLIETRAQVRTEFDEDALRELAADIAANGVLQPILLRPNPGRCNYLVIAGERRFRAARMAQLDAIPAIVGEVTDDHASAMQIAENIQREDLSLGDTAKAVRKLYELYGNSATAVAGKLHKSKAWVSKRLAASCPSLRHMAREILEDGITEDLEIILLLDKLQLVDYCACQEICRKLRAGEAGRQTVREAYDAAKAERDRNDQEAAAKTEAATPPEAKADAERKVAKWKAEQEEQRLKRESDPQNIAWRITHLGEVPKDQRESLNDEHRKILAAHLKRLHESGKRAEPAEAVEELIVMHYDENFTAIEVAAYATGMQGRKFDMDDLISLVMETIEGVLA